MSTMNGAALALTDDELSIIMDAAKPLEPERRSEFLAAVARELAALGADMIGPGVVARLCRTLQHEHWAAPADDAAQFRSKYR
jgi:hypothetical protein